MGLAKNSLLYLISNISIKATSFFLLPLYSHLVAPEVYGHIYVVAAFSNFLAVFLPLSMSICISRFFFDCKTDDEVNRLYSTIVLFVFLTSAVFIIPCFVFLDQLSNLINLPRGYVLAGLVMSFLNVFYQVLLALLYACQKAVKVSVISTCVGVFQIIIQLVLVLLMEDKGAALLITMLIHSVTTFVIFVIYSKPYLCLTFNWSETGKYIKYSLSQFPSDVSNWLVNFTDRIFINKYINSASAGVYGIGSNIGQIPMMIFNSLNSAFSPYVNSQYKTIEEENNFESVEELKNNLSKVFMVVSSLLLMLMTSLVVMSNNIMQLLNPAYSDAFIVIVVMMLASLMNNFRCIFMAPLAYNISYTKVKSIIWVFAGVINILMNFYLIPRYGIYSACINSLITYTITFFLMLYYGKKAISIDYDWSILLKTLAISAVFSFTIFLGSGWLAFVTKVLLLPIYIYVCDKCSLKINLNKILYQYVKIIRNKQ